MHRVTTHVHPTFLSISSELKITSTLQEQWDEKLFGFAGVIADRLQSLKLPNLSSTNVKSARRASRWQTNADHFRSVGALLLK